MVLVCLPTHTRNPAIRFTPLQCEHCTHPTSILLPNGQLSVFTVCEPVLSSSVRALPKATVRAGMVLTGAEYCYRAFSQCLFTVQEWGLLLKSGRRSGFATVIYTALVRSHQSTSAGSFGLVRPAWIRYTRSAVPQDVEGHTRPLTTH